MLRPCPHREIIPGPLATPVDLLAWAADLDAAGCEQCAAPAPPAYWAEMAEGFARNLHADGAAPTRAGLLAVAVFALAGAVAIPAPTDHEDPRS